MYTLSFNKKDLVIATATFVAASPSCKVLLGFFDSKIHSFTSLRRILNEVQKEKRTIPNSKFGSCGINSDANPCGDADEY